ncbi:MAG: redoxin family protein [Armatimonadota bacterium]
MVSRQATGSEWPTTEGGRLNPLHPAKGKVSATFFILSDCPIANGYAPEIGRIISHYKSKGILFSIVYEDSKLTAKAAKAHAKDFGYTCPLVLDTSRTLAKSAGVTVSPEVVVVGPKGSIVYRGRIDDRAVEIGKIRPKPTKQDLRLTLDALLARKPVPVARTKAVGCVIGS